MATRRPIKFTGYRDDRGETHTHYPTDGGGIARIPEHNAGVAKEALATKRLTPTYAR